MEYIYLKLEIRVVLVINIEVIKTLKIMGKLRGNKRKNPEKWIFF